MNLGPFLRFNISEIVCIFTIQHYIKHRRSCSSLMTIIWLLSIHIDETRLETRAINDLVNNLVLYILRKIPERDY